MHKLFIKWSCYIIKTIGCAFGDHRRFVFWVRWELGFEKMRRGMTVALSVALSVALTVALSVVIVMTPRPPTSSPLYNSCSKCILFRVVCCVACCGYDALLDN